MDNRFSHYFNGTSCLQGVISFSFDCQLVPAILGLTNYWEVKAMKDYLGRVGLSRYILGTN